MKTKILHAESVDAVEFENKIIDRITILLENFVDKAIKIEPNPDRLLNPNEVAKIFGVSLVTLWTWSKNGKLIPYKIGSKVRYRLSEINKFINENKQTHEHIQSKSN